ncbi:MAG: hypothetical protein AAFP84_02990 [Actinomycetota bacterium]
MYIFSRSRLAGSESYFEAMTSAVEAATKVTEVTGIEVFTWRVSFGAPLGTITWSCRIDSQADLSAANEKLAVDTSYMDMALAMGSQFEGHAEDALMRVVSGTPSSTPSKYYVATLATMANGRYRDAMTWGAQMQEFVCDAQDAPGVFGSSVYGGFGTVGWLMGYDSMEAIDAGSDWEATNEEYHERLDAGSDLFIPGSGQQRLIERLT